MVSTLDFESKDPSSNLGGAYFTETSIHFFLAILLISEECTKVYLREAKSEAI